MYMNSNLEASQCWRAGDRIRTFLEGAGFGAGAGIRNYQIGSQEPGARRREQGAGSQAFLEEAGARTGAGNINL